MPILRAAIGVCAALLITGTPVVAATITVAVGANLQQAIDNAQPGDTILLEAGATFTGNFVLPAKSGSRRSSRFARRRRIRRCRGPACAHHTDIRGRCFRKSSRRNTSPALRTAAGAHHSGCSSWSSPPPSRGITTSYRLGDGSTAQNQLAGASRSHRRPVYIHGDPDERTEARDRAQQRRRDDRQLLRLRHQVGGRTRRPSRMERTRAVRHHEQLPRGGRRERALRRRGPYIPNLVPSDIVDHGSTASPSRCMARTGWR